MFTKVVGFAELIAQGRWKVEFFISDGNVSKCTAYPLVLLRDVFIERRETLDPQQYAIHLFNYLGLEHIQSLTGDLVDNYSPREGGTVLSRSKVFHAGDILYGRLRPSLNKVFLADDSLPEGICSGEFYVLIRDGTRILPNFARALLASRYVQDVVKGMTTGSALPRLQLDDLLDIEIPLPALDVQRGYEEKLTELRAKRRGLMVELCDGPAAELEALVIGLEQGTEPDFERVPSRATNDLSLLRLPADAVTTGRGRGRPTGHKQDQLLIELS